MADEGAEAQGPDKGEAVKPVVIYEIAQFADTEGRAVTQLTPAVLGAPQPVRYRGRGAISAGPAQIPFEFEIEAGSMLESFKKYDARAKEEGEKIAAQMRQKALLEASRSPKINDFLAHRRGGRPGGGNGGGRLIL